MKIHRPLIGLCLVALLSACGSGGGGGGGGGGGSTGGGPAAPSGPVASAQSFPLQSAYSALIARGATKTATISGTCSGTATFTTTAATGGATFENTPGRLSATSTQTTNRTNCTPAISTQTFTEYYDTNYVPLGFIISDASGGFYGVFITQPNIPASVKVKDSGTIGTENIYTDITKSVPAGTQVLSYMIEDDTATTAIVNLILRSFNTSGVLTATQSSRYRIAATGPLIHVSFEAVTTNGSTTKLVYQ